jgi:formylglycine-generating enzyme required for sulfatase activity
MRTDDSRSEMARIHGVPRPTLVDDRSVAGAHGPGKAYARIVGVQSERHPTLAESATMHSRWKLIFSIATCAVAVLASSCSKHPTKPAVGQVTPSPLAFGSVAVGGAADLTFTIKNTGGGTLSGTVGAGAGAFTVVSGSGSYSLTAGQEKAVMARFAPTAAGAQQYVLPLGSSACADLTCTGTGTGTAVLTPACRVTPSPLVFGSVTVGSTSELSFTITNTGGGTLSGTVGVGTGAFTVVSGSGSYSLTAGQVQSVTVRFAPTVGGAQQYALPLGSSACADLTCAGTARPLLGELVLVPAGNFTMGSTAYSNEQPVHTVYLDAFYIDKYEVANAQFKSFIDAGGYTTQAFWSAAGWSVRTSGGWTQPLYWSTGDYHSGPDWPDFPVVGVSWYEAEAYANFAGRRLPTEAEWEKAARGTDQRTYPWGNSLDGSQTNYWGSGDPYESSGYTTPVGFYDGRLHLNPLFQTTNSPSFYGAYDMAGNVWEWAADWYQANYYSVSPSSNPPGPLTGSYRTVRGGAWYNGTGSLRSAYRIGNNPADRNAFIGFRCAKTLP